MVVGCMIVVEPFAPGTDAVCGSIGLAAFDSATGEVLGSQLLRLDCDEQKAGGRDFSFATLTHYYATAAGCAVLRDVLDPVGRYSVADASDRLSAFWKTHRCTRVYGYPAAQYVPLLEDLFGGVVPWANTAAPAVCLREALPGDKLDKIIEMTRPRKAAVSATEKCQWHIDMWCALRHGFIAER